jgi:signal transduction histidine kinase/PAS domain-containing protein
VGARHDERVMDTGTGAVEQARGAADLLDSLGEGVLVLSAAHDVEYANAQWQRWLGAPVAAGTPFSALLDGDANPARDEIRAVFEHGGRRAFELCLAARKGVASRRVDCTAARVGASVVLQARVDLDDVRGAMPDVARRLAEVVDMAEVLRTLCNIATRQCEASGAAVLRVLGHQGEVVAAVGDLSVAKGRTFPLAGSLLAQVSREMGVVREDNYRTSGRPLMREVPELALGPMMVAPLQAHGEILGVLAVARGVDAAPFGVRDTERLRMLADHAALAVHKSLLLLQAQSADRAKGRFLATMSHELRTPLTALAGYNELLIDQVIGPVSDSQLDILERMRSVTMHLSAMIEEILSFTSLEEGRELVRPSEFLAADLIRSAVALVQPLADQRRLDLEVVMPRQFVRMTSDIEKSRQILINLLSNAMKFTDSGKVTVRLSSTANAVRIEIADTGIGIPPDELSRLFRPFAQVDTGLTRRHGGTGLGLYISRRLATMLGGHIEVNSEVGKGSTFTIVLPLVYEPPLQRT